MLFIGFKYKLNITTRLGHGNPFILLTQHNITSLVLEATLGCTVLENWEDPSQQSVLLVTKATTIVYKTQKVSHNSSVST